MLQSAQFRRGAAAAAIMFGLFALIVALSMRGFLSPLSWFPVGVSAALLIRWGRWTWPGIVVGAALAGLLIRQPPYGIVAGALLIVAGPWLLAWLLERTGFRHDFARRGDVVRFVVATPLAMLVPPTLTLLTMAQFVPSSAALREPLAYWVQWWQNGTISVMLIAPAVIAASPGLLREWLGKRYTALVLLLATAALCMAMFLAPGAVRASWLPPIGVLIIVVSVIRMDLTFTGLLTAALTLSVALSSVFGEAPMQSAGASTARAWSFCMVLAGVTLILRALLAERDALDQRLRENAARYRHGLLEAAAREQERIGRDVHDALGQELTAISLLARSLEARTREQAPQLREDAEEIVRACWRAVQSARSIARGLVPSIERGEDLVHALRVLAERISTAGRELEVRVVAAPGLEIEAEPARNLYRIAQEALNNVLKHSRARLVRLHLAPCTLEDGRRGMRLSIEDDGVGLTIPNPAEAGLGQRTMQYRAEVSGGSIRFESMPAGGTRVTCDLPLSAPEDAGASAATLPKPPGAPAARGADEAYLPASDSRVA